MPIERVELATYAPDALSNNPASLTDGADMEVDTPDYNKVTRNLGTVNVIPTITGYRNLVTPTVMFGPPDAAKPILGAYVATKLDGSTLFFAGTSDKLWQGDMIAGSDTTGTWTERTRAAGGDYSNPGGNRRWHFAQLGDTTIATSYGNKPQFSTGGVFDDIEDSTPGSGAPPEAQYVAVANNFVILAHDDGTNGQVKVSISGFGKFDYWTTGDENLAESFFLFDSPGDIVGLKALGRDVYVYKERATHFLTFSSSWQNNLVSMQAGAVSQDAVVDLGERHVTMGYDNFYEFQSGGGAATLKNPLYDKIFGPAGDLDRESLDLVQGRYDMVRDVVFWHYPSVNRIKSSSTDYCDRWVAWGVNTDRWAIGEANVASVVYPNFDTNTGSTYANFGATTAFQGLTSAGTLTWGSPLKLPTDDDASSPGTKTLKYTSGDIVGTSGAVSGYVRAFVSNSGTLSPSDVVAFTPLLPGDASYKRGVVQTGDFGDGVTYKFLRKIRPRFVPASQNVDYLTGPEFRSSLGGRGTIAGGGTTLTVFSRNDLDEAWTNVGQNTIGTTDSHRWFTLRGNARYFKFVFEYGGGQELSGFDVDYEEAGPR
jgi:hypothetical protein